MGDVTIDRARTPQRLASPEGDRPLGGRLGLDVPRETWPTAPELKRLEACGYAWTQLHAPPLEMLGDPLCAGRYADCLRAVLAPTALRVVLHAPDRLRLGSRLHDRAFGGLLDCAAAVGAELIVCHAAPAGGEEALRRYAARAERAGLLLAIENLAPAYPVPPARREPSHAPLAVRDLVRRIDSPAVGMALDLGHAHVTSALEGVALSEVVEQTAAEVVLFHVHDNLGARRGADTPPGIPPLRLDLHMAPGRGTLPWPSIAPLLRGHDAPLLLEIAPGHRPEPLRLATVSAELLTRR